MKSTFSLILLGLIHVNAFATNYYVSSKKGMAENNGLSVLKPKNTIQEAANLTKPGDTVFVMNGTYTNDCSSCNVVDIHRSGAPQKYIVYINYADHKPILKFDGWGGFSIRQGASYIKIIGFEVIGDNAKVSLAKALKQPQSCANKKGEYNPRYNGNGIAIDGKNGKHPHHIVISRNTVHDCGGGGLSANQADYIVFEDNIVYNTSWYTVLGSSGISFYQFWNFDDAPGYHNVIRRNKCYNNKSLVPWYYICKISDGNGIIIDDFRNKQNGSKLGPYKGRTLIENNICWYNGGTGIHSFQSDHVDIFNNTAYCNSQSKELDAGQILAGASSDIRIVNNILVSDQQNVINSNYKNNQFIYMNNLHYNVSHPGNMKVFVSNSTCVNGMSPDFISPMNSLNADFRLKKNSPAINRGNQTLFSNEDFFKTDRLGNNIPDIGAFEF